MTTTEDYYVGTENNPDDTWTAYVLPNTFGEHAVINETGEDEEDAIDRLKERLQREGFVK